MMKNCFWYIYKKNQLLASAVSKTLNYINWKSINIYLEETKKRGKFDVWDCYEISKDLRPYYFNLSPESKRFCITYWMNEYVGRKIPDTVNIEHGTFWGNDLEKISNANWIEMIMTSSLRRQKILKQVTGKKCLAIGPYLHYVSDYYNNIVLDKIKKKYGKTLLFFSPHSSQLFKTNFDIEKLLKRLKELRNEYNTIMICLFYEDVKMELTNFYSENGFIVVTAGHANDINFLPRLKSIIKIADCTSGITAGTQIGYCIYLQKPHFIIPLGKRYEENCSCNVYSFKGNDGKEEYSRIGGVDQVETEINILKCFTEQKTNNTIINKDQIDCADKYFGLKQIKTIDEIKDFLYGPGGGR